jgi:hypothetical protein
MGKAAVARNGVDQRGQPIVRQACDQTDTAAGQLIRNALRDDGAVL